MVEWVALFAKLNKNVSANDARLIFMQIDKNSVGSVSLSDLVPVVFSRANKAQIRMIIQFAGTRVCVCVFVLVCACVFHCVVMMCPTLFSRAIEPCYYEPCFST
jgi:hypothetical protein